MQLQEVFDQLSSSEFSQLSLGGLSPGVIDAGNWSRVVDHINLALTALHTRFTLKEGRLVLGIRGDTTEYKLKSPYAVNAVGSMQPNRYILDTSAQPFLDDIAKVESVLTAEGIELGLNNLADVYSVATPSALVLRIPAEMAVPTSETPDWLKTKTLTVVYRATHPKIVVGTSFRPSQVEVQLPDSHLEALLYYVASRAHSPVGMSNEFHMGNSYYAKYEAVCQNLEARGMQVDQGAQNQRLVQNGWV